MNIFETHLLANRLAADFLQQNQDLNSGIAKIADERDLSRVQIQGLVGAVNHATNDMLRKSAEDKTYTFDLADMDMVIKNLDEIKSTGVDVIKVASALDKLNPDSGKIDAFHKQATEAADHIQEQRIQGCRIQLQKIANLASRYIKDLEAEKVACYAEISSELDSLTQIAKNYLVQTPTTIDDLRKVASEVELENDKVGPSIIAQVEARLEKLGHPFTGMLATDAELKADRERSGVPVPAPEVRIINGASPVVKSLKQINRLMINGSMKDYLTHELHSLSSTVSMAEKSLGTNDAVKKHVEEDLDSFYSQFLKNREMGVDKLAALPVAGALFRGAAFASKKMFGGAKQVAKAGTKAAGGKTKAAIKATGNAAKMGGALTLSGVGSTALKAGQAVTTRGSKGLAYSGGGGASDASDKILK